MKHLIALAIAMTSINAQADGFLCQTVQGDLSLKVYNHTQPEEGTRNAAVMVLSNPEVQSGRKTIAVFRDATSTLSNKGSVYTAKVDLRFKELARGGEYIAGTRLENVDRIKVAVDHWYNEPVEDGAEVSGRLAIVKRDGEAISRQLECVRYLKGE